MTLRRCPHARCLVFLSLAGDGKPDLATTNMHSVSVLTNTTASLMFKESKRTLAPSRSRPGNRRKCSSVSEVNQQEATMSMLRCLNSASAAHTRATWHSSHSSQVWFVAQPVSFNASIRDFAVDIGADSVAIGDVNRDGKPDLITTYIQSRC
jgi:hypothetical protein